MFDFFILQSHPTSSFYFLHVDRDVITDVISFLMFDTGAGK